MRFDESISGTELVDVVWVGGDGLLVKLKEDTKQKLKKQHVGKAGEPDI